MKTVNTVQAETVCRWSRENLLAGWVWQVQPLSCNPPTIQPAFLKLAWNFQKMPGNVLTGAGKESQKAEGEKKDEMKEMQENMENDM